MYVFCKTCELEVCIVKYNTCRVTMGCVKNLITVSVALLLGNTVHICSIGVIGRGEILKNKEVFLQLYF